MRSLEGCHDGATVSSSSGFAAPISHQILPHEDITTGDPCQHFDTAGARVEFGLHDWLCMPLAQPLAFLPVSAARSFLGGIAACVSMRQYAEMLDVNDQMNG